MTHLNRPDDADLFRHYQAVLGEPAPDATTLAAYAEGRLPAEAEPAVAAWLAAHPGVAEDIEVARMIAALGDPPHDAAAERIAARAEALVLPANVVPLRRPGRPRFVWREAASWTALAASVALAGWLGFSLGTDSYGALSAGDDSAAGLSDVLDPPAGLFGTFAENPAT